MESKKYKITRGKFLLITAVHCFLLLVFGQCKKDEPVNKVEVVRKQLNAQWKVKSVTIDDMDHTDLFAGFTLSFSATTYTTTNGGTVWPASGTWQIIGANASVIEVSGLGDVEIELISNASLILVFAHDKNSFGPGRTKSISGIHRFDLIK